MGAFWLSRRALASSAAGNRDIGILFDHLVEGLDVGISAFAVCDVRRRANLVVQDEKAASLHYVLSGSGLAQPLVGTAIPLAPHTVVILPPEVCMVVGSDLRRDMALPEPKCEPLPGGWQRMVVGAGAPGLVIACGAVHATHRQTTGLFDYLRAPLVESVAEDAAFRAPFQRLLDELAAPRPGTRVLAETLMKQCLIVLLRRHCESGRIEVPWLAAHAHPRLGRVIEAMLDHPERPCGLQDLAEIAGMSRAAFAERFRSVFGRSPMAFLKSLRLRKAADLLLGTELPVKTIAGRVGFASRSHFSRAFKAHAGLDPAAYQAAAARSEHKDESAISWN